MSSLRTAEFVSPKHPDKICDQISDAILDAHLTEDPNARVAVDCCGGHGELFITGEVTSHARSVNVPDIVQRIAGAEIKLIENIAQQSPEIARGVDIGGAGDQGIMVGYACDETVELLPLEYVLARSLNQYLYSQFPYDGKTQITTKDRRIDSVVASWQRVPTQQLDEAVTRWLRDHGSTQAAETITHYINPAGDWSIGGFDADAGLTGRKLAVDNYGPRVPLGGGAFSGKDPSKVDRSAAYMARRIAVDYLKRRHASEVYVYLAYAIGKDEPLEATVIIDGRSETIVGYDLTPSGIIEFLDLKRPIYEALAREGHHFIV
jgi:S-adenosylmethionine synthetase